MNSDANQNKSSIVNHFCEKYEKSGKLGSLLINNFYRSISYLTDCAFKHTRVQKIHEVACGPGQSTKRILGHINNKNYNQTFTASDYEIELVDYAQKTNPEVQVFQESIYDIKSKDSEIDLIFALEVLEHLENPEAAIKELARVSQFAIISTPNEPLWRIMNFTRMKYIKDFGNTPGHINHWMPHQLQKLLKNHFIIIDSKLPIPWQMYFCKSK
ncbi:class I SAM-dependent methyltransferase [Oscillatoria amoena NRMC-F 0135]|nr:class I SAM-dependent methyltransferase [Oscillatoria laete-virens]MDL5047208.1 class I SAM-dependent methyltransferase [Oscillatoria amoena NRMC-F 0135]MDL5055460.1 class I SAM-dependent methyltransferase [Oscillatoria laete-virens NRMC-F 0139]